MSFWIRAYIAAYILLRLCWIGALVVLLVVLIHASARASTSVDGSPAACLYTEARAVDAAKLAAAKGDATLHDYQGALAAAIGDAIGHQHAFRVLVLNRADSVSVLVINGGCLDVAINQSPSEWAATLAKIGRAP